MTGRNWMRGLAWCGAGLAGVALAGAGTLLVVNRDDRPPSPEARAFEQLVDARPTVDPAANGYVYALGMDVPRGEDVQSWGARRQAWLQALEADAPAAAVSALPTPPGAATRDPDGVLRLVRDVCRDTGRACERALHAHADAIDRLLETERWRLDRYAALLDRPAWVETIPSHAATPLPAYRPLLDGQRLFLLQALRDARRGRTAAVHDALERDARFWRRMLGASDLLISKMVAVAGLDRHFAYGAIMLAELPAAEVGKALPSTWREPLTLQERSLRRALAGELRWAQAQFRLAKAGRDPSGRPTGVADRAGVRLLQPQDTANRYADRLLGLALASEQPVEDVPAALAALARAPTDRRALPDAYNPSGQLLLGVVSPEYARYVARASDLEGVRRMALLAAGLHAEGADAAAAPARIRSAGLRQPYTGDAFGWDPALRQMTFTGIEPGARGTHVLAF